MYIKNADYSNIKSVQDLMETYNIPSIRDMIEEKKSEDNEVTDDDSDQDEDSDEVDKDDNKGSKKDHDEKNIKGRAVKGDKLPVIYSDLKAKPICIFKHIIFFTNDRSNENKTLKNVRDALKKLKNSPQLHVFVVADMDCDDDETEITIDDGDEKFTIKNEDNTDTLIFARLSVEGDDDVENITKTLQDRGFLVLNPVRASQLASNKYESACLFEKANIPQPRFCLMNKDILYDKKSFDENIKRIYPQWSDDEDKNKELKVVCKILDGHGGTGVSCLDGKALIPVLQTIFAIDPERQLILQKKEEADGGDIRVHVMTLRTRQVIMAAMKRDQIGGDFRSNVSLGAQAEPIKLTPEQEQIALRTAAISGLPWCAVDIMPLVKGSDRELGDNAVLEINASPGTAGITEVIGVNFINVILNELNDPSEFMLQEKTAGYIESCNITFVDGVSKDFLAKLDTGNSTSANTLEVGEFVKNGNKITFKVDGKDVTMETKRDIHAVAGDNVYIRPVIIAASIKLGQRKILNAPIAVVKSRDKKTTNLLMCRDTLSKLGYAISPTKRHILTKEMEKVKVI